MSKKSFTFSEKLASAFVLLPNEQKIEGMQFIMEYGLGIFEGDIPAEFQYLALIIEKDNKVTFKVSAEDIGHIVGFLNSVCGTRYRISSASTKKLINARMNEGFTVEDFETVIRAKYAEWHGTKFERYLCPETLFGLKFEKYLNGKSGEETSGGSFDTADFYDSAIMRAYGEKI